MEFKEQDDFYYVDEEETPQVPVLVRTDSQVVTRATTPIYHQQARALVPTKPSLPIKIQKPLHARQASIASPAVVVGPATGISVANAFGSGTPLPVPLTISGAVTVPLVKTDSIANLAGEVKMSLGTAGQINMNTNSLNSVGLIQAGGIYFPAPSNSTLNAFKVTTGTYALTTGCFVGGSGTFKLTQVGSAYTLLISEFSGTTAAIGVPGGQSQGIVFTPTIATSLPPRGTFFPVVIKTAAQPSSIGVLRSELLGGTDLNIQDTTGGIADWQWVAVTPSQGWQPINISWNLA